MKLAKADLVAALQLRYDHYSAQTMFDAARKRANLDDVIEYDRVQVAAFRAALAELDNRLGAVDARLDHLLEVTASTAASIPAPKQNAMQIVLTGIEVPDGEQVLVCGDRAELGDWDPARARPMTRDADGWITTLELAPGIKGSFKFLRRAADGTIRWESGEDRQLEAVSRIEASWQRDQPEG
jgi:hypothetical protein